MSEINTEEIYHHGVKGQRWGIRRYQNPDGTLTPAGKKRADKMKEEYTALTGKRLIRKPTSKKTADQNNDESEKPKSIKKMSDQEIKDRISRLENEKRLAGLEADTASTGKKASRAIVGKVLAPAAMEAGKELVKSLILKIGKEKLGLDDAKTEAGEDIYKELKKEVEGLRLTNQKMTFENNIAKMQKERDEKNESSSSDKDSRSIEEMHKSVEDSIKKLDNVDVRTEAKPKESNTNSTNFQDKRWRRMRQLRR